MISLRSLFQQGAKGKPHPHKGRPGEVGGSAPGSGSGSAEWKKDEEGDYTATIGDVDVRIGFTEGWDEGPKRWIISYHKGERRAMGGDEFPFTSTGLQDAQSYAENNVPSFSQPKKTRRKKGPGVSYSVYD